MSWWECKRGKNTFECNPITVSVPPLKTKIIVIVKMLIITSNITYGQVLIHCFIDGPIDIFWKYLISHNFYLVFGIKNSLVLFGDKTCMHTKYIRN